MTAWRVRIVPDATVDGVATAGAGGDPGGGVMTEDMIAEILNLAESLPSRIPSTLRVGPYVPELLRLGTNDQRHDATQVGLPLGVTVIRDDSYAAGEWRLFDQWDEELHSGQIEALRGVSPDMTVHTEHLPPGIAAILIAAPQPDRTEVRAWEPR